MGHNANEVGYESADNGDSKDDSSNPNAACENGGARHLLEGGLGAADRQEWVVGWVTIEWDGRNADGSRDPVCDCCGRMVVDGWGMGLAQGTLWRHTPSGNRTLRCGRSRCVPGVEFVPKWREIGWDGWSAGGRVGARCDGCGVGVYGNPPYSEPELVLAGPDRAHLFEHADNGDTTLRCGRSECDPNLEVVAPAPADPRAGNLAVDAPWVGPRRVQGPRGPTWVEARNAARAGAPRVARPGGPGSGAGVAPAVGRPGEQPSLPLTGVERPADGPDRVAVYEAVGQVAIGAEVVRIHATRLLARESGAGACLLDRLWKVRDAVDAAITVAQLELQVGELKRGGGR